MTRRAETISAQDYLARMRAGSVDTAKQLRIPRLHRALQLLKAQPRKPMRLRAVL